MAPRANWKGFLRLSLVTCPVALYPATSDSEKVSFNQINRNTGHRIKYSRVDAETGEEVASEDIVKAFKIDTDTYVEVSKEELENVALESTRTIEIDEFAARDEIDPRYIIRPYYLRPDGKVGHDAFAVIREGGAEPAKPSKPAKKPRKAASGQKGDADADSGQEGQRNDGEEADGQAAAQVGLAIPEGYPGSSFIQ
jgi:non-homologous end joining protein Ku